MASEPFMRRCRSGYAKLLHLYPRPYRKRFAEGMEQTFNDLCRERAKAGRGLLGFAVWIFFETSAGIIKENAISIMKGSMKRDSTTLLRILKHSGITLSVLMVAGIGALMVLSRGKGEDIAGIVAAALFVTFISSVVAIVAAVFQKRARKAVDLERGGLS